MSGDSRTFLEDMVRRGYVHEFHRVLGEHDPECLEAYEQLLQVAYLRPRRLSRLTKEFVHVALLAGLGANREHLKSHMAAASAEGATSADMLELLELLLPIAGVTRFADAIAVWNEVFGE